MKKICLLLLYAALSLNCYAQNKSIDSLKQKLLSAKSDTNKVNLLWKLAHHYNFTFTDTALTYANQSLALAKKLDFKKGEIRALLALGGIHSLRGDYPASLSIQLKALQLAESVKNDTLVSRSLSANGFTYLQSGNYQKSLDYLYKRRKREDWRRQTNVEKEADAVFTARAFFKLNKLDSTQYFEMYALALDKKNKSRFSPLYNLMAEISGHKGEFRKAINYLYPFSQDTNVTISKPFCCGRLAEYYQKIGYTDSAIYFAKETIVLEKQEKMFVASEPAIQALVKIYTSTHQVDSAFKYLKLGLDIKDTVFSQQKLNALQNISLYEQQRQRELAEANLKYQTSVRMYTLVGTSTAFLVIGFILWRNNRRKQAANVKIQKALDELKATQAQLIQREKMASLGELTAGIAHEIQNPLNFVNNFSEVSAELADEMDEELEKGDIAEAKAISADIKQNLEKIRHHGKRADFIVKGMLQHSRASTGEKQPTNMNVLCEEFLNLAYHGLRAKDKLFHAETAMHFDPNLPRVNVVQQDMGRVMLNLFNNAFYAVNQKAKTSGDNYRPTVEVSTTSENGSILIKVKDNGNGISDAIKDKIMQPFFTTKPTGEGTGLGLSLSYDIVVKGHGGSITVDTKEGEFTEFIVQLPT